MNGVRVYSSDRPMKRSRCQGARDLGTEARAARRSGEHPTRRIRRVGERTATYGPFAADEAVEIISTHQEAEFDSFASMVATSIRGPLVFPGSQERACASSSGLGAPIRRGAPAHDRPGAVTR
jgi:hypothetical protein